MNFFSFENGLKPVPIDVPDKYIGFFYFNLSMITFSIISKKSPISDWELSLLLNHFAPRLERSSFVLLAERSRSQQNKKREWKAEIGAPKNYPVKNS